MSEVDVKQQVAGYFRDLEGNPESESFKIYLSEILALYKNESQIIGAEKTVQMDEFGEWQTELIDTDNMVGDVYYNFEINGRIYRKLVPVASHCRDFNDLPDFIF